MFDECLKCNHREVDEKDQDSCELALVGSEIGGCSAFIPAEQLEGGEGQGQGYEADPGISATVVLKDKEGPEETVEPGPNPESSPPDGASGTTAPEEIDKGKK